MTTTVLVRKGGATGKWSVVVNGRSVSSHRLKNVALRQARRRARARSPSVLRVQTMGGQWRTEASYP